MPVYIWLPAVLLAMLVGYFFRRRLGEWGVRLCRRSPPGEVTTTEPVDMSSDSFRTLMARAHSHVPSGGPESVLLGGEHPGPIYHGLTFIQLTRDIRRNEIEWSLYRLGLCLASLDSVQKKLVRKPDDVPLGRIICSHCAVIWRTIRKITLFTFPENSVHEKGDYLATVPIPNPCHCGTGSFVPKIPPFSGVFTPLTNI